VSRDFFFEEVHEEQGHELQVLQALVALFPKLVEAVRGRVVALLFVIDVG